MSLKGPIRIEMCLLKGTAWQRLSEIKISEKFTISANEKEKKGSVNPLPKAETEKPPDPNTNFPFKSFPLLVNQITDKVESLDMRR